MSTSTNHLPRRIPLASSTVADQIASSQPLMESLEPRLLLSGDGIDIEKYVYVEPAPPAGDIMCNDYAYGKPVELTMKYTGGGADATDTLQPLGKYNVTDAPGFEPYEAIVDIIATSSSHLACASPWNTFFSGQVALGDEFVLDVDNAACLNRFSANTYIYIMDTEANLLQTVQYHTSCSAPIHLGDVVGGVEVTGFFGTNGIGAELPDEIDGYGEDADTPGEAIDADIGQTVVWTYVVTRTGDGLLSDFTINDDNGTPDNAADDFSPAAVMDGDFNVGDTNTDGVLDEGEQWLFAASDLVEAEGLYGNVGTASATVEVEGGGGSVPDGGFMEYAILADGSVTIGDFFGTPGESFNVDGGFLGSNGGDITVWSKVDVSDGLRGGGLYMELYGGSTIGSTDSGIEDAMVFNGDQSGASVMLGFGTTVYGNIRGGGTAVGSIFGWGADIQGDIYTAGDLSSVDVSTAMPPFAGTIYTEAGATPFTPLDFESLDDFNPALDVTDTDIVVGDNAVLELSSGNYQFDSLTFGEGGVLQLNLTGGPITIQVVGDMTVGSGFDMVFVDDFGVVLADAADQVYIEAGYLTVGENAEWSGTVYVADDDINFGQDLQLTGALYGGGDMNFLGSEIVYEAFDFEAVAVVGGGVETIELDDSDSAHYVGVLPSIDISRYAQKAEALVMQYTGDNVIDHSQDPCKVTVTGDPDDAPVVRIVASSRANIDDPKAEIYFDGEVNLDDTFAIDALLAGKSRLKGQTYVKIFAPGLDGELLGSAGFHTSLSEPLVLGDQFGAIRLVGFIGDDGARAGIVPVEMLTGLSGFVFEDFNGDGQIDLDEYAVSGATVTLSGVNDNGIEINRVETTDSDGAYYFDALRPGNYTITETQPVGYDDGIDSVGTAGGILLADDTVSEINLDAYVEGVNYNFAEHRAAVAVGEEIAIGQTATIGFWAGRKGKKLIESLNGSKYSTELGDWLATEFPDIYGKLAGKTNKAVASFYKKIFKTTKNRCRRGHHGHHQPNALRDLNAQVMATALAIYVTDSDLAGNTAARYGFLVSEEGLGAAMFSVGDSGAAFGLSVGDSRIMSVWDILHATNDQSVDGRLYDMDIMLQELADKVYTMINEIGAID